jgi:hypothetical protein
MKTLLSHSRCTLGSAVCGAIFTGIMVSTPAALQASSHREAPFILKYPQVDATDFYAFNSYEPGREHFVTFIANYNPTQSAYSGPNYYPLDENALYEIHIDNDGDAVEDLTFQFDFDNRAPDSGILEFSIGAASIPSILRNVAPITADSAPGLAYIEHYEMRLATNGDDTGHRITDQHGNASFSKPVDNIGSKTFGAPPAYEQYARSFVHQIKVPGCDTHGRVFAGQRLDPFKIALGETFDLVNYVPIDADSTVGAAFTGAVQQDAARNDLARNNVTTLALELPVACITGDGNGVIGSWTTASLPETTQINPHGTLEEPERVSGPMVQVSRLGSFLVNELFIGFPDKNTFNSSEPKDDTQFASYVTNPAFPAIVDSLFRDAVNDTLGTSIENLAPSNLPRQDLVSGFLTGFPGVNQLKTVTPSEMLRLNTGIPVTPRADQQPLGVAAGDLAGFPNGRRPGDDAVDIGLRVAMGALCYPLPIGEGLDLGLCTPDQAPIGNVALTDGVPLSATDFDNHFPYLVTPYAGSPGMSTTNNTGACIDSDGDGFGWDGFTTCIPDHVPTPDQVCIDTDGDGYGWNGTATCTPPQHTNQCIDTDGDGYGWDGTSTCIP